MEVSLAKNTANACDVAGQERPLLLRLIVFFFPNVVHDFFKLSGFIKLYGNQKQGGYNGNLPPWPSSNMAIDFAVLSEPFVPSY